MNPFRVPPTSQDEEAEQPRAHRFRLNANAPFAQFVILVVYAAVLTVLAK